MKIDTRFNNSRLLIIAVLIILFTTISGVYLYNGILKSADEIIADNKNITKTAVAKLGLETERNLKPVWAKHLEGKDRITKADERIADSLLSIQVQKILSNFHRVEGGLYFYKLDEFIGYSFPTIEEPKPAFGPPPRSYNIIRNQVRTTIEQDTVLTLLHQFDPAIFPLSTQPIYMDGEIIGATWARIHIERKLATSQNIQSGTFFLTVGAILLSLTIAILILWNLRRGIIEIKQGLNKMKTDSAYRLPEHKGIFGYINRAINDILETQQKEYQKRKELEQELYQKDKMATLGNVIAGTAHEINTPISIIKTRIQIWERKLRKQKDKTEIETLVSDESLQMVHDEIERVSNLTKRLLYFSKSHKREKIALDPDSLLKNSMRWIEEAFPEQHILINYTADSSIPAIYGDQDALKQVLTNILKNAVEASPQHCSIDLFVHQPEQENYIEITVCDYGKGMPDDIKQKIFDPFFTTKESGVGLGLSISREIIKSHKGSIYFQNHQKKESPSNSKNGYTVNGFSKHDHKGTICVIRLPINS